MAVSDDLYKLGDRARTAEDRAVKARTQAKDELQREIGQVRKSVEQQGSMLHAKADSSKDRLSSQWQSMEASWNKHIAKIHEDMDRRKAELDKNRAVRRADNAESDAEFAIDFALGAIEEAEYAVLDAIESRMEADELLAA